MREPTSGAVTTRRRTAPIATVSSETWITEATLSQSWLPVAAPIAARAMVSSESPTATLTTFTCACELVSATTEVALVATVSSTEVQPRLSSSDAST